MPKEIIFFSGKNFSIKNNFFQLMNQLITSHSSSLVGAITTNAVNHIQILSSFFSKRIGVFEPDKYKSDYILFIIEKIFRIKDLFINNYLGLQILNCIILIILLFFFFLFFHKGLSY